MHPEITSRSCEDCKTYLYNDTRERMGLPVIRAGRQELRGNAPTPCRWCPKLPADVPSSEACPEKAVELSQRNYKCLAHYLECRAVGRFPDDAIVRRNAMVIRSVMDDIEHEKAERRQAERMLRMMSMAINARAT